MNSFIIGFDALALFGSEAPTLNILLDGDIASSVSITANSSSYAYQISYEGSGLPALSFQFADAGVELNRDITIESVSLNGQSLDLSYLGQTTLLQNEESSVDVSSISFALQEEAPQLSDFDAVTIMGTAATEKISGVGYERDIIDGGGGDDEIHGEQGNDQIWGGNGNDDIRGQIGDDLIVGGAGDDRLTGSDGNDALWGGIGADKLGGGNGSDFLSGNEGADKLYGNDGDDIIYGGADNDKLYGGAGLDILYGGDGNDLLQGDDGDDIFYGGAGIDKIRGGNGDDEIHGGDGDDAIKGHYGNDAIYGDAGNDVIEGHDGEDVIDGGDGNDRIDSGIDNDTVYGGAGDDKIYAGAGDDIIDGGNDDDVIDGDDGNDIIDGGFGNDKIYGGAGDDVIQAGSGRDFVYAHDGNDTINGGNGRDLIDGGEGNDIVYGDKGTDKLSGGAGNDTVYGGAHNDVIYGDLNAFYGNILQDSSFESVATPSTWTHYASIGAWEAVGQRIEVWRDGFLGIDAGHGDNFIELDYNGGLDGIRQTVATEVNQSYEITFTMAARPGTAIDTNHFEVFFNNVLVDTIIPIDTEWRQYNVNVIGTGSDIVEIRESASSNNSIGSLLDLVEMRESGGGDDTLYGGSGDDLIYGNAGDDVIYGGTGSDSLQGGQGADTFVFEADSAFDAVDEIQDFELTQGDALDISDILTGFDSGADDINDFVQLSGSAQGLMVSVDTDGTANGSSYIDIVNLNGASGFDVDTLISNGNLIV